VTGQPLKLSARLLREALDLAKCVAARQVLGGTVDVWHIAGIIILQSRVGALGRRGKGA
jgi:hypothetical protein